MPVSIVSISERSTVINVTPNVTTVNIVAGFAGGPNNLVGGNIGSGTGIYKQKNGNTLEFKSLVAGTNVNLVNNTNDVTFNVSAPTLNSILTANNSAGSIKIINLGAPSNPNDAARLTDIPTSLTPTGSAGGDLSGTYPNPTIKIQAGLVSGTYGDGSNYSVFTVNSKGIITGASELPLPTSMTPSGSASGDLTGTYPSPTIVNAAVSYAKIQNISANSLLGRTTGAGSIQEISLGSGLTFTGTTLDIVLPPVDAWLRDGNPVSVETTLGTTTAFDLPIIINSSEVFRFKVGGLIQITNLTQDDLQTRLLVSDSSGNLYYRAHDTILTNGNATSANGTAIDLGGTMNNDISIDGTSTYGLTLLNLFDFHLTTSDDVDITSTADINLAGVNTSIIGTSGISLSSNNSIALTVGSRKFQISGSGQVELDLTSDATGDIYYRNSSGQLTRLGIGTNNYVLTSNGTLPVWAVSSSGGSGTVSSVSVVNANGFDGTVATATSTPAITLSTTVTGILKGNGTAISAAVSGTDYSVGTSALATGILKSTTTTGALTIAIAADFPTLNQSTTGNAASATALQTSRNIQGVSFDGTANINIINGTGFVKASGTTISYDNSTYLTANQTISFTPTGDVTGSTTGTTSLTPTLSIGANKVTNTMLAGSIDLTTKVTGLLPDGNISSASVWNAKVSSQWTTTGSDIYYNTGNVIIGSASAPSSKLHIVETSTSTPRGVLVDQYNTGINGSRITMRKARGTFASPTVVVTGDVLGSWTSSGYDGANFIESGKILSTSIGTIGTNIVPSKMEFQTANSSGTLTTGLTLDQAQNITIVGTVGASNFSGSHSGTSSGTNTGDQTITLTGDVTGSGTGSFAATLTNTSVTGQAITGYVSGAGTVAATDTILQAIQKLNGNDGLKWQTTGTTTVTTPTISGNVTWSQSSQSATNTFHTWTQAAHTGGSPVGLLFTGGSHTTLANANAIDLNLNLSRTVQFGQSTTLALQTAALFDLSALTYSSSVSSKTITKAIGVQIKGIPAAGTNASITNPYVFAITDTSDNVDVALGQHNSNFGALIFGTQARANAPSIGAATNPTTFSASGNNFKFQSGSVAASGRAGFSFASTSTIGFPTGTSTNSWIYSNAGISMNNSGVTATHNHLDLQPTTGTVSSGTSFTLNISNSAPVIDINAAITTAVVRGYYYNPTQTTVGSNVTNKAWEHTSGYIQWNSVLSPAQITSNQNDYNPAGWTNGTTSPNGASILRLNSDAARSITSLAGGVTGRIVEITNTGSFAITFLADDGSTGTAANRFILTTVLNPGETVFGYYDGTSSRWRLNGRMNANGQVIGTATNDNATAGNVGEEIDSTVSTYTNFTTTATYQNITSITLTPGDWDISAFFTYSSNSATITAASNAIFAISTTTASAAGAVEGQNISYVPQAALLGTSKFSDAIPPYRVTITSNTTYYLNGQATFTIGNPQVVGSIRARRMR